MLCSRFQQYILRKPPQTFIDVSGFVSGKVLFLKGGQGVPTNPPQMTAHRLLVLVFGTQQCPVVVCDSPYCTHICL